MSLITKIFGTRSQREIKKIQPMVDKILGMEEAYKALPEEALKAKTQELKDRLNQGETLDSLLPEAFAAIREAADRVLGMRPFPVQLMGGIILHQGRIAEMKTGEGKTLVAILPAYLNALTGRGVHIVTVNDYLAKYQSEWMGKVFRYMGLTVGLVIPGMTPAQRRVAYNADVTYCTNNELGFDYLRDNMAIYKQELVQRGHYFAIVDEVDSILIDEARTPLIISGKGEDSSKLYEMADQFVATLHKKVFAKTEDKEDHDTFGCDYYVDEKSRTVGLTSDGVAKAERFFGVENLADSENATLSHHINQAIEAKEGVTVAGESKTLATITFQNFFRLYDKLSGMTGTALTEQEEFESIYKLDVVEIPTNRPVIRIDHPDVVYKTEAGKFRAITQQVKECHAKGQPVLVGTISIEKSEILSKYLKREGIPHNVLNAKYHELEAQIVAQAGKLGAVTIATNMAGRGTDILLGGNADFLAKSELRKQGVPDELIAEADSYADTDNQEVLETRERYKELLKHFKEQIADEAVKVRQAGGLFIIGTERHESRRIDNQLRGRSGRQGDPGESRFYLSMQDDLMRLFAAGRVMSMMDTLGLDEDTPIDAKILSGAVENAQKTVESRNFQTRKHVLEYDDVMNVQREVIYAQRQKVLNGDDLKDTIRSMIQSVISSTVTSVLAEAGGTVTEERLPMLLAQFDGVYWPRGVLESRKDDLLGKNTQEASGLVEEFAEKVYSQKETMYGEPLMRELERVIMLRVVDEYWMDNIDAMDDLKQGIGLRAYGQHDPVVAYKEEGYQMFQAMIQAIREETVRRLFLVQVRPHQEIKREKVAKETGTAGGDESTVKKAPVRTSANKVGPNDPCPCGSGLKYKKCCMQKNKKEEV